MKKIYSGSIDEDREIRGRKPLATRTIFDDDPHRVDIHAYLVDPEMPYWKAVVEVVYKGDDVSVEFKYDSSRGDTADAQMYLDACERGINNGWGGAETFIKQFSQETRRN